MAPTINNFNITEVANASGNKLVALMKFTSKPSCVNGECATTIYDYLPGMLILLSLAFIIFFSLKIRGHSTTASFTAMAIANVVIALLMYPLEILSGRILLLSIILLPVAGFMLFIESK